MLGPRRLWSQSAGGSLRKPRELTTFRTGHGTTDWFQIRKEVRQACILSPCLFNFYAEYIIQPSPPRSSKRVHHTKGDPAPTEQTRDCSPGHAGKEDPHLAMTGASCWFSRAAAPVWGFSRGMTGSSGSLSCGASEVRCPCAWRGGHVFCI